MLEAPGQYGVSELLKLFCSDIQDDGHVLVGLETSEQNVDSDSLESFHSDMCIQDGHNGSHLEISNMTSPPEPSAGLNLSLYPMIAPFDTFEISCI